ncbi:hypothetical protein THOG05_80173 [Vibrio rotiferianus]|nr:hypothetical protein THOG05_80173 [Vibrio rotiferianus]CAH1595880.1 hypothetical protein THOG10_90003 [Vibrio rotiferianus]CAH1596498.1 hypothetical protein THOB06_90003 [Vibrio rotiferianus]
MMCGIEILPLVHDRLSETSHTLVPSVYRSLYLSDILFTSIYPTKDSGFLFGFYYYERNSIPLD